MKSLLVKLPDDVYAEIKDSIMIRHVMGNLYGPGDEFGLLIIRAIEKGDTELVIGRRQSPPPPKRRKKKR